MFLFFFFYFFFLLFALFSTGKIRKKVTESKWFSSNFTFMCLKKSAWLKMDVIFSKRVYLFQYFIYSPVSTGVDICKSFFCCFLNSNRTERTAVRDSLTSTLQSTACEGDFHFWENDFWMYCRLSRHLTSEGTEQHKYVRFVLKEREWNTDLTIQSNKPGYFLKS